MIRHISKACLAAVAAATFLAAPVRAFTVEGGEGADGTMPKFDIEEQTRNFRSQSMDLSTPKVQLPGGGSMQFSTQPAPMFGSPFGFGGNAGRQHFDRMLDPSYQLPR